MHFGHTFILDTLGVRTIKGNTTKVAFFIKVFSSIVDYGMDFQLLQFDYDLWLFKTVSAAWPLD